MAEANTCDVCGRSVTITTTRGEKVTGLQGYRMYNGSVLCHGNQHAPDGKCMTTDSEGQQKLLG